MMHYYDRAGIEITVEQAYEQFGKRSNSVAFAYVEFGPVKWLVSTVHLILDHRFIGIGPPLIFETMILPECTYCIRTSTYAQALAAHAEAVGYANAAIRGLE